MLTIDLLYSVCLVSIIRLYFLHKAHFAKDWSYYNTVPATWSSIEINIGILCASLPTLKAFLTRFFPTLFASRLRQRNTTCSTSTRMKRQKSCVSAPRFSDANEWVDDISRCQSTSHVISEGIAKDVVDLEAAGQADEYCKHINVVRSVKLEYEINIEPVEPDDVA